MPFRFSQRGSAIGHRVWLQWVVRARWITQDSTQNFNSTLGIIGGTLIGGELRSLVGGGNGQTVATIVGAGAGARGGNRLAQRSQTLVWRIGVRYDDGTFATVQQTSAPALRFGDRVQVTSTGIQLLR